MPSASEIKAQSENNTSTYPLSCSPPISAVQWHTGDVAVSDGQALVPVKNLTQEAWIAPTLLNSWVNFGAAPQAQAGYYKDTLGVVHLRGMIKNGSAVDAYICTLPAGYRPEYNLYLAGISANGSTSFIIDVNGGVQAALGGSLTWTSLSGLSFRAA